MILDSKIYGGPCTCGREHPLLTKFCLIEPGAMKKIGEYADQMGFCGTCAAIYDRNTYAATEGRHPRADLEIVLDPAGLHANELGVRAVQEKLPEKIDYLIAVGSGTVHDITRYCAYQRKISFISCPTAASVDGFCSSVAAMTFDGCKKTVTAVAPGMVIADTDIIAGAPLRLAKSGFGDMIGKWVALADWKISHILTGEFFCQRIYDMMMQATRTVTESAEEIMSGSGPAFEKLISGLLQSGLFMQMMGNSRPASGAEHHISHLIEISPDSLDLHSDALHGEKVGVASVLASAEYHRIAGMPTVRWKDYPPITSTEVQPVFGSLSTQILLENEHDCAKEIRKETVAAHWEEIRTIVAGIPTPDELLREYRKLGVLSTLTEIGVPESKTPDLLKYSPLVRNRLTLMRLRRAIESEVNL